MPSLSDELRNALSPQDGPFSRNGNQVPGTNAAPLVNANCASWALSGQSTSVVDFGSANRIYLSADGAYVFDQNGQPTALRPQFFETAVQVFPDSAACYSAMVTYFDEAVAGGAEAQAQCARAMMILAAMLNGHTVLEDNAQSDYTMVMRSPNWFAWEHWALGVRGDSGTTTYQQKVTGSSVYYGGAVTWDELLRCTTTIKLGGLLDTQIAVLNAVL